MVILIITLCSLIFICRAFLMSPIKPILLLTDIVILYRWALKIAKYGSLSYQDVCDVGVDLVAVVSQPDVVEQRRLVQVHEAAVVVDIFLLG